MIFDLALFIAHNFVVQAIPLKSVEQLPNAKP